MADIWMDVDTAVVIPVNSLPLVDDSDFKTIETAVVYNSAGLVITWNFVTTAGVHTANAITPTTGGAFDWSEPLADVGMYSMELPASGQTAGTNNDREGFGWITGVATGVLPWRGPVIGFRAAALNNSLVDGTTIDVNVTAISGDATAADNAELMFDGTGYAGGTIKLGVDLVAILGTALTETSGYLAAGFKKFFNILNPVSTMDVIATVTTVTTATNLTNAPTNGDLTAAMKLSVNAEVDTALNTAIPGGPTADSINERIATMDGTGVNVASQSNIDFGALQKTSLNAATPAVTVSDKTGFSLSTAGILAIWHQLTAAIVTASTIGKLIVDYLDAAVSSRNATTPPTASAIADQVWDEAIAGHAGAGSTGAALSGAVAPSAATIADAVWDEVLDTAHEVAGSSSVLMQAAGAAADPLLNAVPGAYASGTAGYVMGHLADGAITVVTPVATSGTITIERGDAFSGNLSALGDISTRTKLWFTVKDSDCTDADAIIQIEETAGLIRLNGAVGTAIQGDITVTNAAAGNITITMKAAATSLLGITTGLEYDVQWLDANGDPHTLTSGALTVSKDITRATS